LKNIKKIYMDVLSKIKDQTQLTNSNTIVASINLRKRKWYLKPQQGATDGAYFQKH